MPHRTSWPRPPSALPPSTPSTSSADKPLGWLLAALRRGRGERRTFVQDPPHSPPLPITPVPTFLPPAEGTHHVVSPPPPPPPPNMANHRLHPINVEATVAPVPPPLGSPNRRAVPPAPSTPSRRPNVEMHREYDLSSAISEVDLALMTRPPTPAARRTPRMGCSLPLKRSIKVNPMDAPGESLCAICLGELLPRSYVGRGDQEQLEQQQRLGCGHVFHAACLQGWLQHQWQKYEEVTCPMCRASVLPPIIGFVTADPDL
eukprot:gnl/MRDRNA2_/MRDRNA2_89973_c0_seq1.p1 gnl/MRDRNA2_/MRDRNA2_89973_c0~~gnl/MRDRNA2_/MRDRNA2_89973_c0_seq1.p1  ORF type:complete len:260 (-),score=40.16 gnl/MRDRNA2_/MRDRNA2_89973_c0_seq1:255-1034(-)